MIPLTEPNMAGKEAEYVQDAIRSGHVSAAGGYFIERFEEDLAKANGLPYVIATITGSAALHASMEFLWQNLMEPDYEKYTGYEIVLPQPEVFPAALNAAFNVRSVCNLPRRFWEDPLNHDCNMIAVSPLPGTIADCAPAIGHLAPIIDKTPADFYTLSFNGNKTVTTGQGGAILTDSKHLADNTRKSLRQTQNDGGKFNYLMSNLTAAVGCAQMERLDELLDAKQRIFKRYEDNNVLVQDLGESRWACTVRPENFEPYATKNGASPFESKRFWGTDLYWLPCSTTLTVEQQDEVLEWLS